MANPKKETRLSLPLMFAFREAHRERDAKKTIELKDSGDTRVLASRRSLRSSVSEGQLRGQLTRDLDTLMNTINLGSAEDLGGVEAVGRSILNFGLPDMVNRTAEENRSALIVDEIKTAILDFEPRLIRKTVKVKRDESIDTSTNNIRFIVDGDMSCNPVAVPVEFYADLEVSSGRVAVNKR